MQQLTHSVDGLPIDLSWPSGIDPSRWRDMVGHDNDDDYENDEEEEPTEQHVIDQLGFDPDELDEFAEIPPKEKSAFAAGGWKRYFAGREQYAKFEESEHPRDEEGKFSPKELGRHFGEKQKFVSKK